MSFVDAISGILNFNVHGLFPLFFLFPLSFTFFCRFPSFAACCLRIVQTLMSSIWNACAAAGLRVLQEKHLIHRDLKPQVLYYPSDLL